MTLPSIATIINFCSNDYPFLRPCIEAAKLFSKQIIIPVCDHFFDGLAEDRGRLDQIYSEHPDVEFVEFPFQGLYTSHSSVCWHNLARLIGRFHLKQEIEYVLFLDSDEIVDTHRFCQWLESFSFTEYNALRFYTYWYFRESNLQAKTWEQTSLMMKKDQLTGSLIMNDMERAGMYEEVSGKKIGHITGHDQLPMFHHYSWVRTKEQLLRKVRSWSHNWQGDWVTLVETEFSHPFTGKDFVHGYEFNTVNPYIDIDLLKQPQMHSEMNLSHVRKLSPIEMMKIDLSLTYQIPL